MSSIINKSNTRFKPKFGSRPNSRVQSRPTTNNDDQNQSIDPLSKLSQPIDILPQSTQSGPTQVNETNPSLSSLENLTAVETTSLKNRRASTRLGSISNGTLDNSVSRRPSFMQSRRPSAIGATHTQVVASSARVSDILTTKAATKTSSWRQNVSKDSALLAMKRKRKGSIQQMNKNSAKLKTASQLSTALERQNVSNTPIDPQTMAQIEEAKKELSSVEDDMYKIKSLKDVPKSLSENESKLFSFDNKSFTMAELCKYNLPIGKVTSNYIISKEASKKKKEEREKRKALRKLAREQNKSLTELTKEEDEEREEKRRKEQEALLSMDIPEPPTQGSADLQLKLDKDGNIILDESSAVIDKHEQFSLINKTKEVTQETNFTNLYNNGSYTKQQYTDPWTVDEEIKFYKSLSKWGTDFNFIAQLFPYRNRRQIKLKFSSEEKKNPVLIELALKRKLPFDFDMFVKECKIANTDNTVPKTDRDENDINDPSNTMIANGRMNIITLEQYEQKLAEVRLRHEESLKQIQLGKEMAKTEDFKVYEEKDAADEHIGAGGLTEKELDKRRAGEVVVGYYGQRKLEEDE
ncbi:unnamed protein product [Hanseniaspora opuntiae]